MASKWVKVSDSGSRTRVIFNPKRKRASQIVKASTRALAVRPSLVLNHIRKRKLDESCESKCFSSSKNLLKNYSNFMKSGVPQRLLFSQDGQWNDYSQDVIDLVKEDFLAKKSTIEVKINGRHIVLDILHMIEIDLETGVQKAIAWIDETGSCLFPEIYSSYESHECNKSNAENDIHLVESESCMTPEVKLHVEIELDGTINNNFEECMDESYVQESNIKRVKLDHNLNDNCNTLDTETIRDMFIKGNPALKADTINVKKCSGDIMESMLELFEKQVEITQKLRGNANVKYAWFASSTNALSSTVAYGLGHDGPKLGRYGYGVHLTAVDSAQNSATNCDVDEKGARCMVLCRVILGNMELVLPGSKQVYPSDDCFDSGVDNLDNPNHYVVWNMNMNTHIYPEYTVSFKIFPSAEDNMIIDGNTVNLSSRVTTKDPQGPLQLDSSSSKPGNVSVEKVPSVGSSASRTPKSPWMPFSKLFEAISDKLSPDDMKLVHILYESLKGKKTSREEFIKKLRVVVGDQILRSTISSLQSSMA